MLCAPSRQLAVDAYLAFENALDAALETLLCGLAAAGFDKSVQIRTRHFAQEFHHPHHRIIIERDVPVILFAWRIELRPSTRWVLCLQNVVEASAKRLLIRRLFGC